MTVEGDSNKNYLYYISTRIIITECYACCYSKVVLQVGWSFRQLGVLTMDCTYQGSFSALASIGKGDHVFAVHRNLSEVDGLILQFALAQISPKQVVREARPDQPASYPHSGGSLLLLPWLGSVRGEKAQEELMCHLRMQDLLWTE